MNIKSFEYGRRRYSMQANSEFNLLSIFIFSISHCSHHHEHPAH